MGRTMAVVGWLALTAAVAVISGCGGGALVSGGSDFNAELRGEESVWLQPEPDVPSGTRWMDVADILYDSAWRSTYGYGVTVDARYHSPTADLVFDLYATDLKPNLAYQVKLEGLPDDDPWANQALGELGRWWGSTGYLVFGHFAAEADGTATVSVPVDSSYHVLWKTSQRPPLRFDGPVIDHHVVKLSPYYSEPGDGPVVGVYGEREGGRPKPGKVSLPAGTYHVLLRLAEESFHSNDPDGGDWSSVLDAPVTFTISRSGPPSRGGSISGRVTDAGGAKVRHADLTLTDQTEQLSPRSTRTKGNGKYVFKDVAAGDARYTVNATKNGQSGSQSDITVQDGGATVVDLQIQ